MKKQKPKKKRSSKTRKTPLIPRDLLISTGVVDKHGKLIPREPVLSEKALAYAAKIVKSRRLSIKFLKEAGIIERPGRLARPYH
jgi:ribosomal protein S25